MHITAIITAAGLGRRMGGKLPKQFLELGGQPMICRTLEKFQHAPSIDSIIVTIEKERLDEFRNEILKWWPVEKIKKIVAGGVHRQDSIRQALSAIDWPCDMVAVHDGVRPFVRIEDIEEVIKAAQATGSAILATPLKETIKRVSGSKVVETVDRAELWGAKTPQVFRRDILAKAYEKAYADNFYGTDDASLVERLGNTVSTVHGDENNIKITTPEDFMLAEILAKQEG